MVQIQFLVAQSISAHIKVVVIVRVWFEFYCLVVHYVYQP